MTSARQAAAAPLRPRYRRARHSLAWYLNCAFSEWLTALLEDMTRR